MAKPNTVLNDEQLKLVEKLSGIGCNLEEISHILNINPRTMDRIVDRQPEVKVAIERGKSGAGAKVMSKAYDMAVSGKHPVMTIFWLKVRKKWREARLEDAEDEAPKDFTLNYKK